MREVILQMSVSIDGFVAGRSAGLGGSYPEDPQLTDWKAARVAEAGLHIMGRVTYEQMAAHWPTATDAYAAPMNDIPKLVFSRALEQASWPDTLIARGDLAEEIARLKQEPGKNIIAHGGATFVQALSRLGLIDQYRLVVEPVAMGEGLPMFKDLHAPLDLRLVEVMPFETGTVVHIYRPTASSTTAG